MPYYVTLMGAEDVSRAGYTMREAAHEMSRAAGNIDEALRNHQRFLDDWLQQLASVMQPPKDGEI